MTLRRFSSRTHRLDQSFLAEQLKGALSYRRIAGYFTSSLFEVAHEWLEQIPDVKIVCNVDIHPDDLKVAQCREAKMLGRWNANAILVLNSRNLNNLNVSLSDSATKLTLRL